MIVQQCQIWSNPSQTSASAGQSFSGHKKFYSIIYRGVTGGEIWLSHEPGKNRDKRDENKANEFHIKQCV